MRKTVLRDLLVFLAFLGLTILLTCPAAFYPMTTVPQDPGDPLFYVWVIGWNYHTIFAGHFARFWDANIFYPLTNTLALGEHGAYLAFLGLPFYWFSGSLLFVYNCLFLLSFALSGYAVFRLTLYMIPSVTASFFAGLAFAFCTYRFDHLGHVNVLQTQWLPLLLLSFIAFVRERKTLHAVGLCIFFIANALAFASYMVFMIFVLGALFPLALAGAGRIGDRRLWVGFALAGAVASCAVLPFVLPLAEARDSLNLGRSKRDIINLSATPRSFLSGPVVPRVFEPWLTRNYRPEVNFFAGFLPIILGLGCLFYPRNLRALRAWLRELFSFRLARNLRFALSVGVVIVGFTAIGLLVAKLAGASLEAKTIWRVARVMFIGVAVLGAIRWRPTWEFLKRYLLPGQTYRGFLLLMVIFAVLLSMGPSITIRGERVMHGPYYYLHKHISGLDAFRSVGRIAVLALMGLSVMAAYGFADIERRLAGRTRLLLGVRVCLFGGMLIESLSVPVPIVRVPTKQQFPEVYRWLAAQPGDFAIAEVPMGNLWDDVRYQYFSTSHWKRLVNGYNAFVPPDYFTTAPVINQFPAPQAVETLGKMGVKYLIFHAGKMNRSLPQGPETGYTLIRRFGDDFVYEIATRKQ